MLKKTELTMRETKNVLKKLNITQFKSDQNVVDHPSLYLQICLLKLEHIRLYQGERLHQIQILPELVDKQRSFSANVYQKHINYNQHHEP